MARFTDLTPLWFWQKVGSPVSTAACAYVLRQPNRYRLAASVRREASLLSQPEKIELLALLVDSGIVKPAFGEIDPEQLRHFHFCKITAKHIEPFVQNFNRVFSGRLQISCDSFSGFSVNVVKKALPPAAPPADAAALALQQAVAAEQTEQRSLNQRIREVLVDANRPLTVSEIAERLAAQKKRKETRIAVELGRMGGEVIETVPNAEGSSRFFLRSRVAEVLNHSLFVYQDGKPREGVRYIYQLEAEALASAGKAVVCRRGSGDIEYLAAAHFEATRSALVEVKDIGRNFWVLREELSVFVAQRKLVQGMEDETFKACYVYAPAQNEYAGLIFNCFAKRHLDDRYKEGVVPQTAMAGFGSEERQRELYAALVSSNIIDADGNLKERVFSVSREEFHPLEGLTGREEERLWLMFRWAADGRQKTYQKLKAAFRAGLQTEQKVDSVDEFLYEARRVSAIGGNVLAVALALSRWGDSAAAIKSSGAFCTEEIALLEHCHGRLEYTVHFPFFFNPGFAHSLQTFMNFIYDQSDYFEVFQVLLVRKLNHLRQMKVRNDKENQFSPFVAEAKLVYASMAEKRGWLELAGDMRELVFKLEDPQGYEQAGKIMEGHVGMRLQELRRHLASAAEFYAGQMRAQGIRVSGWSSRVKERGAYWTNRVSFRGGDDRLDFSGIRFRCRSLEEAYAITNWLREHFRVLTNEEMQGHGSGSKKKVVEDNLVVPRPSGWRGWRMYARDPLQSGLGPQDLPRAVSVQVLTEKMERDDKSGEAAHWQYKAQRVARNFVKEFARQTGCKGSKEQFFDFLPPERYAGNAEHDYYVDQAVARKHKRVFIWGGEWRGAITSVDFGTYGIIDDPLLRLPHSGTVEDAVGFRSNGRFLIEGYKEMQVYVLRFDRKTRSMRAVPAFKGRQAARLVSPPNGAVLVMVREGKGLNFTPGQLIEMRSGVKTLRARLLVTLGIEASRNVDADMIMGRGGKGVNPLMEKITRADGMTEVLRATELRDEEEVRLAVALGLLGEPEINEAIGFLSPRVAAKNLGKGKIEIAIQAPDQLGLILQVLQELAGFRILSAYYQTTSHARGRAPAKMGLVVRPEPGDQRRGAGVETVTAEALASQIESGLEGAQMRVLPGGGGGRKVNGLPQAETIQGNIFINPADRIYWEGLRGCFAWLKSQGLNTLTLDLPDLSVGAREAVGSIVVEHREGMLMSEHLAGLQREIEELGIFREGVEVGIV